MQKAILIAEKGSLAQDIRNAYENNKSAVPYEIVTFLSQRGHLVTLKTPDEMDPDNTGWTWESLPFHPEDHGGWQYKVIEEKKTGNYQTARERYEAIKAELKTGKYDFVIHAGDPGQEGELLINLVLAMLKNSLPVKRFWTNDMTEKAIVTALQNLKDDDKDPMLVNLMSAAVARQHSDWRVGMNLSRAASIQMNGRAACGRVKTPLLSIVCKREEEIRNFKPHTVYGVKAEYTQGFTGSLFDVQNISKDEEASEEQKQGLVWFETRKEAQDVIDALGTSGAVTHVQKKQVQTYAPKQFKLATLQIAAGRHGINDDETLAALQSLYEKKLMSYPRTDCEYLSSNEDFYGILKALNTIPELSAFIKGISKSVIEKVRHTKKWCNDDALLESDHSALRPTTTAADITTLSKTEKAIYLMVCRQFIAMFLPPLVQDKVLLVTTIDGKTFRSSGKSLVDAGFTSIFGTKITDVDIPDMAKGDVVDISKYEVAEKTSVCLKRYTTPELIAVCENPLKYLQDASLKSLGKELKLGTPATRSSIIKQLIQVDKYLERKKEGKRDIVVPTASGEVLAKNLTGLMITRVDMTGLWEEQLDLVRKGGKTRKDLETEMIKNVNAMIEEIRNTPMATIGNRKSAPNKIGTCPICGNDLAESEKGYYCRGYKKDGSGCNIKLWKNKWGTNWSKEDFFALLNKQTITKELTVSGKTWVQDVVYDFNENDISYAGEVAEKIGVCPECGSDIMMSEHRFFCSDASCALRHNRIVCGHELTSSEYVRLISGDVVNVTCSKDDKSWEQPLVYDKKDNKIGIYQSIPLLTLDFTAFMRYRISRFYGFPLFLPL